MRRKRMLAGAGTVILALAIAALVGAKCGYPPPQTQRSDSAGALCVTVRDAATGEPLTANAVIIGTRCGGIAVAPAPAIIGLIPRGTRILKTMSLAYHAHLDTVLVDADKEDSVVVLLRKWRHIRAEGDVIHVSD